MRSNGFINKQKIKISKALNRSIRTRLIMVFLMLDIILFIVIAAVFSIINHSLSRIGNVYASNITTNELSDSLKEVQNNMYEYLNTRGTQSLEQYYKCEEEYMNLIDGLNDENTDDEKLMLEKNIRSMSENYLELTEKTIQEKRGRNVEKYKTYYEESTDIYDYINEYISILGNSQFRENSNNYTITVKSMRMSEAVSMIVVILIAVLFVILLSIIVSSIIKPLVTLADTADSIASGNLDSELVEPTSEDEIGVVTNAFNSMVISLRNYMEQMKQKMETERMLKEHQLLMETHLKDAQLKYLQAQINPHFLFNCLNAGVQLAIMENAEKTSIFVQKMADFFRYNVKKIKEESTLGEEIEAVDNYIYILNVRYDGDIQFEKNISENVKNIKMPSMILQPLVENAVNHGLNDMEENKRISLNINADNQKLLITIEDNGKGMTSGKIEEIINSIKDNQVAESSSTGIGMVNVVNRLELFFEEKNIFCIKSDGLDKGTQVIISVSNDKLRKE